jgi:hypothetical protein
MKVLLLPDLQPVLTGANCSIGAWFYNPCLRISYYSVSTFTIPTTVSFTDTGMPVPALEARSQ